MIDVESVQRARREQFHAGLVAWLVDNSTAAELRTWLELGVAKSQHAAIAEALARLAPRELRAVVLVERDEDGRYSVAVCGPADAAEVRSALEALKDVGVARTRYPRSEQGPAEPSSHAGSLPAAGVDMTSSPAPAAGPDTALSSTASRARPLTRKR